MLFCFSSAKIKKLKSCHGCCEMTKGIPWKNDSSHQIVFHGLPVNEERQKAGMHVVSKEK